MVTADDLAPPLSQPHLPSPYPLTFSWPCSAPSPFLPILINIQTLSKKAKQLFLYFLLTAKALFSHEKTFWKCCLESPSQSFLSASRRWAFHPITPLKQFYQSYYWPPFCQIQSFAAFIWLDLSTLSSTSHILSASIAHPLLGGLSGWISYLNHSLFLTLLFSHSWAWFRTLFFSPLLLPFSSPSPTILPHSFAPAFLSLLPLLKCHSFAGDQQIW